MDYEDAVLMDLSYQMVVKVINSHNLPLSEFIEEVGKKEYYSGQEVLDWLGY